RGLLLRGIALERLGKYARLVPCGNFQRGIRAARVEHHDVVGERHTRQATLQRRGAVERGHHQREWLTRHRSPPRAPRNTAPAATRTANPTTRNKTPGACR